jgi:hypothetical protein
MKVSTIVLYVIAVFALIVGFTGFADEGIIFPILGVVFAGVFAYIGFRIDVKRRSAEENRLQDKDDK